MPPSLPHLISLIDDQNLSGHPFAENGNAGRGRRLKHAVTGLIIGDCTGGLSRAKPAINDAGQGRESTMI